MATQPSWVSLNEILPPHLQKLGELIVRMTCIEKRCVDLIILKENPALVTEFNAGTIGPQHGEARLKWHRETFQRVLREFGERYRTEVLDGEFRELEVVAELRDVLIHGDASRHRPRILFVPNSETRRKRLDEIVNTDPGPVDDGTRVLDLASDQADKAREYVSRTERMITRLANACGVLDDRIW